MTYKRPCHDMGYLGAAWKWPTWSELCGCGRRRAPASGVRNNKEVNVAQHAKGWCSASYVGVAIEGVGVAWLASRWCGNRRG